MVKYKIILQYDGTRLNGWQKQGNTENTVQGKLERLLSELAGQPVAVQGASRTDAGVHAAAQVADFSLPQPCDCDYLLSYMNDRLPRDIAVQSVSTVPLRFHSRHSAHAKTYVYRIWNGPVRSVFDRQYQWYIPAGPQLQNGKIIEIPPLDVNAMGQAAADFTGTHDFGAFCTKRQAKKSSVRTVYGAAVEQDGPALRITFRGSGFLYNMVRIMVGTLVEIGTGERPANDVPRILAQGDRAAAGMTAPPCGLTLTDITYL